jgi:hypothetical protein
MITLKRGFLFMANGNTAMSMTVEDFLTYVKESKSPHTYKEYNMGIRKFSEWFGKTPNEILEMRRQDWIRGTYIGRSDLLENLRSSIKRY